MDSSALRIMSEFRALTKEHRGRSQVANVRFLDESDIYIWRLQLKNFDNDCEGGRNLNADLDRLYTKCGQDHIEFEIRFPKDYPSSPFFCRVVSPRCVMYTGHVTAGGSICLEMLTLSGTPGSWNAAMTVSGVLVVVLNNMINCDVAYITTATGPGGRTGPLRVDFRYITNGRVSTYSEQEAQSAFARTLHNHRLTGWNSGIEAATYARVLQGPPTPAADDAGASASTHAANTGASAPMQGISAKPQGSAPPALSLQADVQLAGGRAPFGSNTSSSTSVAAPSGRGPASPGNTDTAGKVAQMIDMLQVDASLANAILELKRNNLEDAIAWYFENGDTATLASVNALISKQQNSPSAEVDVVDLCSSDDGVMSDEEMGELSDEDNFGDDNGCDEDDGDDGYMCSDSDVDLDCSHEDKYSTSNITHIADVTKLARKDAEDLLRSFDGNVGDALEQWMNDEVSVREMLDLIPCEQEKQTACSIKSISIRLAQEEQKLSELTIELEHAKTSMMMAQEPKNEELEAKERVLKAQQQIVSSFQRALGKAEDDLKEALASRRVNSVPGDVYQRRISKLSDTWISRVPGIARRPVHTRTGEATAYLYTIHADKIMHPQEQYHFSYVTSQFQRSFGGTTSGFSQLNSYKVVKVEVNENPEVEARYRATRKQFFDAGKPVVEELVFHGNPEATILDQICAEGFEIGGDRVTVRHGTAYGTGVYVARKASLSMGYAGSTMQLLLCKCAIGRKTSAYYGGSQSSAHDSTEIMAMDALVLKSKAQILPKYLVYLKHA